jgi:hypothetical protein
VTPQKFLPEQDAYWNRIGHSKRPGSAECGPLFVDLNGDNVLDFSMASHQTPIELAESELISDTQDNHRIYALRQVADRIEYTTKQEDSHGHNIVDLDGDGFADILVAVGGGNGGRVDFDPITRDNMLFWGEAGTDPVTDKPTTIFRGGQDMSRAAGVNGRMRRGRLNFVLDANGDGLLDIFLAADRPFNNNLVPGMLLINQGNRKWKVDSNVMEYSKSMMLTDVDGDGFATELVINRDACFPERKGPNTDPKYVLT